MRAQLAEISLIQVAEMNLVHVAETDEARTVRLVYSGTDS